MVHRHIITENIFLLIIALIAAFPIFPKLIDFMKTKMKIGEAVFVYAKTGYALILLAISTAILASGSYNPFLYFRF